MPVQLVCATCGKSFSVPPSQVRAGRKYCSLACQPHSGSGNGNWKGGLVAGSCIVCGTETKVKVNQAKNGRGRFCSVKCAAIYRSKIALGYDPATAVKKTCTTCGKEFFLKRCSAERGWGVYCSRECMALGYKDALRGELNPHYKDGTSGTPEWNRRWSKQWRGKNRDKVRIKNGQTSARKRGASGKYILADIAYLMRQQDGKCVLCECSLANGYHVDHRIPIARGGHNNIGNIQLLCPTCNMKKRNRFMVEIRYGKKIGGSE